MNTFFIQPIEDIIEAYMAPDYKQMYEHMLRDFNWVGKTYAKTLCANTLINNNIFDEELDSIFPKIYNEEYDRVIGELKWRHGDNGFDSLESRFWQWAK